jgi:hypothetical protein
MERIEIAVEVTGVQYLYENFPCRWLCARMRTHYRSHSVPVCIQIEYKMDF